MIVRMLWKALASKGRGREEKRKRDKNKREEGRTEGSWINQEKKIILATASKKQGFSFSNNTYLTEINEIILSIILNNIKQ